MNPGVVRAAASVLTLTALAGCPGEAPGDDQPPPDGGEVPDGGAGGLVFTWHTTPAIPSTGADGIRIDEVQLQLRDVRAIGDAAPGDGRTSRASLTLEWDGSHAPDPLRFDQAPPGLYSTLALRVEGGYEIRGGVLRDGTWTPCKIEDDAAGPVSVPLDALSLEVGHTVTLPIQIDLAAVMNAVRWADVPVDDDELVVDEDSPQIAAVRQRLQHVFTAGAPTSAVTGQLR